MQSHIDSATRPEFWTLSTPEIVLFYILVFTSLGYMAWQIWDRAKLWQTGRPVASGEGSYSAGHWIPTRAAVARWVTNVRVFVLGQKKVRESRKNSGAPMHLMIFFGFLALLLATTLLAVSKYGPYNFHHGAYYLIYESVFDFMGVVFTVGVGWALIRRGLSLRKELGPAALREQDSEGQRAKQATDRRRWPISNSLNDWLTLGLLLILSLTGYWLEAARISANPHTNSAWDQVSFVGHAWAQLQGRLSPNAYHFIWWFHVFWVIVFFAVIPKMRLRHIVMAIFAAAGSPETPMGQLRIVTMEEVEKTEQVGVKFAKDYSRWHLMSLDACMECGRCTEVCPAWSVGKVLNPKQVVQDIRAALKSGHEIAESVSEQALWACTTCNACVEACPVLIRHVDLIVDARRSLVSEGALTGSGATMLRQTAGTNNPWGQQAVAREDWMKGLNIPLCRDGASFEYLFWVGCAGATDPGAVKTTKAVAELLRKAGVSFACLGREECCTGDPARRIGEEFLFQDQASKNVSVFDRYSVRKVVTACPHCFNSFKNEYGAVGANLEVWHHSQLLQQLVRKGDLVSAKLNRGEVVLHDPCYLSRINGEVTAQHEVLSDHAVAPPNSGRKTLCCGAGGGRMWMEEAPDQRPASRRAEELAATGATTVAVACPFCRIMLGDALTQLRPNEELKLVDIAELMQEANP